MHFAVVRGGRCYIALQSRLEPSFAQRQGSLGSRGPTSHRETYGVRGWWLSYASQNGVAAAIAVGGQSGTPRPHWLPSVCARILHGHVCVGHRPHVVGTGREAILSEGARQPRQHVRGWGEVKRMMGQTNIRAVERPSPIIAVKEKDSLAIRAKIPNKKPDLVKVQEPTLLT